MSNGNTTLRAWAIPLGFKVFGQEIGDHTWVTGEDRYCDGCRFGVVASPDDFYCHSSYWSTGKYVPPSNPPSRELGSRSGNSVTAKCLGGSPYRFMFIPSQSGVIYAINGVCHTLSNRILYKTGLTVDGAAGYWFIQNVFGVYGTTVPMSYFPPFIGIFPNPLYPVAVAVTLGILIEWQQIRDRCSVTHPESDSEYLRAVDAIHAAPRQSTPQAAWSADAVFGLQEEMYARYMSELRLTVEHRGRGIAETKLDQLTAVWSRVHQPVREHLDTIFDGRDTIALQDLPAPELSETDALYLANYMNLRAAETLQEVIAILGPNDFTTFYGHAPDKPFLVIEPDILKGASAKR